MPEADYIHRLAEIKAKYSLEPTLKELFVEGEADKAFFSNYAKKRNLKYRVYTIDTVDTSSLITPEESNVGKKQKIEKFSSHLEQTLGPRKICVFCICDRDDDKFITIPIKNSYLLNTDFSCIESYAYNAESLEKFLTILIHKKAPTGQKTIKDILPSIQFLFAVRLSRYLTNRSWAPADISKVISCSKNGEIKFDLAKYILSMAGHNREVHTAKEIFSNYYESFIDSFTKLDYRLIMHGHDFNKILNIYQRQLSGQSINDDIFEKSLLASIEAEDLDRYPLFQTITACSII